MIQVDGTMIHDADNQLRIGAFEPRSLVNGPGVRAVLWVQGCGRRCPGCFNPEFLPREGGRVVPVAEVIEWIREAAHKDTNCDGAISGITFSGGEPFDQAAGLAIAAQAARTMGLSVVIFTGHPWEHLQTTEHRGNQALMATADLLIAGPYHREQPGNHPLLASANQRLVFVTDRYRRHAFGQGRRTELRIGKDGAVRTIGFPNQELLTR